MSTHQKTLFVNSRNRITGNSSNFLFKFDELLNDGDYDYVSLLGASIPKSYYLIGGTGSNGTTDATFTIDETGEVGGSLRTITVPYGNYNRINMGNKLESLLNMGAPAGITYTITYGYGGATNNAETGRYTFNISGNVSQPTIAFNSASLKLPFVLGFLRDSYSFSADTLSPPNMVNFNYEQFVYIKSDMVEEKNNILEVVYMDKIPYLAYTDFYNTDYKATRRLLRNDLVGNNTFDFYITNAEGEQLDLNGIDLSLVLVVWSEAKTEIGKPSEMLTVADLHEDTHNDFITRKGAPYYRSTG